MKGTIAIGFTGNYIDREPVKKFYAKLAKELGVVTFFHPLRLIAERFSKEHMTANDIIAESLRQKQGPREKNRIEKDFENMVHRFKVLAKVLPQGTLVKIVFHTEYGLPLWCNALFREEYLKVIPKLVENIASELQEHGLNGDFVVEMHPGFTDLGSCRYKGRLYCRGVERNMERLANCIEAFKRELLEQVNTSIRFSIEPRAGSKILLPQILDTHWKAYVFAKNHGFRLVLDPGQTVLKKIGFEEAWNELFEVAKTAPDIVEEIHIHSPKARKRRGHGIPSPEELAKAKTLIRYLLEDRSSDVPLGVILEVLNAPLDELIKTAKELIITI